MRSAVRLALVLALPWCTATAGDLALSPNLFFIKRSKNANEVHYDARVENCTWSRPEVDSYWRDLQEGPDVFSEIRWWEGPAYGFQVERLSDLEIALRLEALPEKKITVRLAHQGERCNASATVEIAGEAAELQSAYVFAEENTIGWPTVHYVDVLGHADGHAVYERLPRTKRGRTMTAPPNPLLWTSGAKTLGRR